MTELDEVLRVKDAIDGFIDENFDGEDLFRLVAAISMTLIDIGYDSGMSHEDIAEMFIGILNKHVEAVGGPTENDVIH